MSEESEEKTAEAEAKPSWATFVVDALTKNVRDLIESVFAVLDTLRNDARGFVVKFARDMVLALALLFVGLSFLIFGVGIILVEALRLGSASGSVLVGSFFILSGVILFLFSRR